MAADSRTDVLLPVLHEDDSRQTHVPEQLVAAVPLTGVPAAVDTPVTPTRSHSRWTDEHRQRERELFALLADTAMGEPARQEARNAIVVMHLPLVDYCARRFRDRGEPFADLVGYGTVGLIKAVDRFELTRGVEFSTFAMPTIIGEIKRHFRDRARIIRLPRRLIDVATEAAAVSAQLQRDLDRQPDAAEVAARIGITAAEVIEAQRSTSAHAVSSLDALLHDCAEKGEGLPRQLALWPVEFDQVEWRETLEPALKSLNDDDRALLHMRFAEQLSQEAIAQVLGVSQMQVSRLLTRLLAHLRGMLADAA